MIFGNPDVFAFYADSVTEWQNNCDIEGVSGIFCNTELIITNFGLIDLRNEFENLIENSRNAKKIENKELFELEKKSLLKMMLQKRYPNWCARSLEQWEENLDIWQDTEEETQFDFSLESFKSGHEERYYLFGVKHNENLRLLFYIKNDESSFFNLGELDSSDIFSFEVNFEIFKDNIIKIEKLYRCPVRTTDTVILS